jgi:hypothetical protein
MVPCRDSALAKLEFRRSAPTSPSFAQFVGGPETPVAPATRVSASVRWAILRRGKRVPGVRI